MQQLAIYDMDKTITRWPTWTPFLVYAALTTAPWRLVMLPVAGVLALAYAAKAIDRARLKELTQAVMLGRSIPIARAQAVAQRFAGHVIKHGIYREARAQMAADRAEGCRIVMATASFAFYAKEIAARLGMDDVIATESAHATDGGLLAQIDGENCYGPAKLRMIEAWLRKRGWQRGDVRVRFYSDHVSDEPALAWADQGIAITPHPPLRALAASRGWRVIDWAR
jgi:HAD superfamily hydrolase (TIGR01490 family)